MNKNLLIVRNYVFEYRINSCWSRHYLAHLVGTTEKTIEAIENNVYSPSVYLALCLATAFDCKVDDLFILDKNYEL